MAESSRSRKWPYNKKSVSFADQQNPSNLEEVDTFDGIPIIPENLPEISLKQPTQVAMRYLICSAYQDAQLSPTFIDDVMTNLPNYQPPEDFLNSAETIINDTYPTPPDSPPHETRRQSLISFEPTCIEQIPGENDIMSGALNMDETGRESEFDDKTVCDKDIWKQFKYMKWRLLNIEALLEIDGLFNDRAWCRHSLRQFGEDFHITNEGLRRSLEDCNGTILEGWSRDMLVLGAISRRGGRLICKRVDSGCPVYPEDFEPVLDPEDDLLDVAYWEELYALGDTWVESNKNLWPDRFS